MHWLGCCLSFLWLLKGRNIKMEYARSLDLNQNDYPFLNSTEVPNLLVFHFLVHHNMFVSLFFGYSKLCNKSGSVTKYVLFRSIHYIYSNNKEPYLKKVKKTKQNSQLKLSITRGWLIFIYCATTHLSFWITPSIIVPFHTTVGKAFIILIPCTTLKNATTKFWPDNWTCKTPC